MMKLELRKRQGVRLAPQMYAGQQILALSGIALEHYLDRLAQQNAAIKVTGGVRRNRRIQAELKAIKRSYGYDVKVINPYTLDDFIDNSASPAALEVAMRLRRALEYRNHTLQRVVQVLVERQEAFVEQGPGALRPLGLHEVAQAVGLSMASVSRAIKDKKININGVDVPLKSFLAQGVATGNGVFTSAQIKQQMRLIGQRLGDLKVSDRQLMQLLAEQDVRVARRTVAKYRAQINNENSGCMG